MAKWRDRLLACCIALLIVGAPLGYYRYRLTTQKRFRVVVSDRLYRSGQMTADGFADAIRAHGIRTVVNVQNEFPNPELRRSFFDADTIRESELCRQLGVRYLTLEPDLLPPSKVPPERPKVIDAFLALMDDPASFPILLHCKAGLHRTGVLVAVYRMEYDGWPASAAMRELKANGFGESAATSANEYIRQYVLKYQPRWARRPSQSIFSRYSHPSETLGRGGAMKLLDRLVLSAYIRAYLICLLSLLSLYVVIDLFTNLDEFFAHNRGLGKVLPGIARYYLYRSAQIFDRLCEPILLLAAAFTVGWMQRNNELLPLLSAGVPTRRVLRPIFAGAVLFLAAGIANQEFIIPRIADRLALTRDDLEGDREMLVQAAFDSTGLHLEGHTARMSDRSVSWFHCTIPDAEGNGLVHLSAREARYIPPGDGSFTGGWWLHDTSPTELPDWNSTRLLRRIAPGQWFVYTQDVDFEMMTRNGAWYMLYPTARLNELLRKDETRRLEAMAVLFHMRLTRPVMALLLVVMGLSVVLRDPNRHVFVSAGYCVVLCGCFFGAVIACKFLGDNELLAPALAAWLPVLVFGPVAFVMFDAIYT